MLALFSVLYLISVPVLVPLFNVVVPKLWLFVIGNVLMQYPCAVSCVSLSLF